VGDRLVKTRLHLGGTTLRCRTTVYPRLDLRSCLPSSHLDHRGSHHSCVAHKVVVEWVHRSNARVEEGTGCRVDVRSKSIPAEKESE
jgi:hypothetical protein